MAFGKDPPDHEDRGQIFPLGGDGADQRPSVDLLSESSEESNSSNPASQLLQTNAATQNREIFSTAT